MKQNIEQIALEKATRSLEVSPSGNKYQAILNMANNAGIKLSTEMEQYIDDPKDYRDSNSRFAEVPTLLPQLVAYYKAEAVAKDKIFIMRHLKVSADHPLMTEISNHLEKFYDNPENVAEYKNTIDSLKLILIRERLRPYLKDYNNIKAYEEIIKSSLEKNETPDGLIVKVKEQLATDQVEINEEKLKRMCSSFTTLKSIATPEKAAERMVNNVLDLMNSDFKREIIVLNDIKESVLTGREALFRGMDLDHPENYIEQFFTTSHRMLDTKNKNDLFLFDIERPWNSIERKWEVNGAYMSFNPYWSLSFVKYNGLLLEIVPKEHKKVITGKNEDQQEVIANQVEAEEIRAIYIIKDGKISAIHKNPNFESSQALGELSLKIGDRAEGNNIEESIPAYEAAKFNRDRNTYKNEVTPNR